MESNQIKHENNENKENPPKIKGPCCVCKETKKIRDECIMFKSEQECLKEIENHKKCLMEYGFKV